MSDKIDWDSVNLLRQSLLDSSTNEGLIMRALAYIVSRMPGYDSDPIAIALVEALQERSGKHV